MISQRTPALSSLSAKMLSVVPDATAPETAARLAEPAVEAFALGINTALIAALAERGDDVSNNALRRRLQAYATPRATVSGKLRRYA